jgi:hypothetical protein
MSDIDRLAFYLFVIVVTFWLWTISTGTKELLARFWHVERLAARRPVVPAAGMPCRNLHHILPDGEACPACGRVIEGD